MTRVATLRATAILDQPPQPNIGVGTVTLSPKPHDARMATLRAMAILDQPPQPNIGVGTVQPKTLERFLTGVLL